MKKSALLRLALCSVSLSAMHCYGDAVANPKGAQVAEGSATVTDSGTKLDVHQHSHNAVINWNSFDIQIDEHTQFHQPSASATALNRVQSHNPSNILGKLTANGNIILINPNGVFFGQDSVVDVNSMIAATADINNADFMAGTLDFSIPGNPNAAIINEGTITAKEAGLVGLVAPNVLNSGVIQANLGKVHLTSGDRFTLDLYGDGLYSIRISEDVASQLVVNTGLITAEGGTIAITAAAAKQAVNSLIHIEGELHAPTVEKKGGKIIIAAEGSNAVEGNIASDKGQKQGESNVVIANALLNASGYGEGEQGGEIEITGDNIGILSNVLMDASGYEAPNSTQRADGGTATLTSDKTVRNEEDFLTHENRAGGSIKIGGDYLGSGDTATASYVYVDPYSIILNDTVKSGDGGRTVIWSDDTTEFYGNVYARGGLEGGNGGFLETSGKLYLDALGYADLTAIEGYSKGIYLLDPADITVYGNVDPDFVSTDSTINLASDLQLWLDAADTSQVTLTYSTDALGGATASGTSGTNIITTSADVSGSLEVGARIRLGVSGAVTTANTVGADTYTITAIAGTTITVEETLTGTYAASNLYRGLVSQLGDKSGVGNHATQGTEADMALWISNGQNEQGVLNLDGNDFMSYGQTGLPFGTTDSSMFAVADANANGWRFIITYGVPSASNVRGLGVSDGTQNALITSYVHDLFLSDSVSSPSIIEGFFDSGTDIYGAVNGQSLDSFSTSYNTASSLAFIGRQTNSSQYWQGDISETLIYSSNLSENNRYLVNQYQSAKWNIDLTPPGTGATEAARATASDGYSAFAVDYLEKLSSTADIVLQADNTITLDLQGDNLTLTDDRSIIFQTTNGNISTNSAGTITTNRTTTGGNITFTAGGAGNINIDHALTLNAQNGGVATFTAGGDLNVAANINGTAEMIFDITDDVTLNADIATTSSASNALVVSAGDDFINTAGSDALSASNSRWLLYSDNPTGNTRDDLLPSASEFNKTYATDAPGTIGAGNRFVYATSTQPTLNYQVSSDTITYGDSFAGTVSYVSGLLAGDTLGTIGQSGSTTIGGYSAAGTTNSTATVGTLTDALGYAYSFTNGTLTVDKATLNVSLAESAYTRATGEANPALTLSFSGFVLGDTSSNIDTLPVATTTATTASPAGFYPITLSGGSDTNYLFNLTNSSVQLEVTSSNTAVTLPATVEHAISGVNPVSLNNVIDKLSNREAPSAKTQRKPQQTPEGEVEYEQATLTQTTQTATNQPVEIMGGLVTVGSRLVEQYGLNNFKNDELLSE